MKKKRELIEVWITKYALTKGIYVLEVETCPSISDGMVLNPKNYLETFHGNEWHLDEKSAKEHAEFMRDKRIESLRKQLSKIEKIIF